MKEHTVAVRAASPSPVFSTKGTAAASTTATPSSANTAINSNKNLNRNNSNHQLNSSLKPTQRVLSFLKKRTGTTAVSASSSLPTSLERDRVKSTVIPTPDSDRKDIRESASPSPVPMCPSYVSAPAGGASATATATVTSSLSKGGAGNPIKNMIRRRSIELGRLFEGGAGAAKRNTDGGRDSPHPDASQESQSEQGSSSIEYIRSASPTLVQPIPVVPATTPAAMAPSRPGRRPAFALGLSWRPQSEYTMNGSSGLRSGLSRAQRRFASAFPELADLLMVPSAYCAPCLATPPPTPPVSSVITAPPSVSPLLSPSHTSSAAVLSPSGTGNTLTSTSTMNSTSATSMTTLAPINSAPCPGHFDDFACALEREILWQGTLYVTATHVCFYGRHFGKTVRVMIDYQDLVSVEKEKKMGVFPSSIRVRVRTPQPYSAPVSGGEEDTAPTPLPSTKDYVFTSLMSREQAYAIIERNWALNRQVMNSLLSPIMTPGTLSTSGFETPRSDTPDPLEKHTTLMFDLDFEARRARSSGSLRAHRRKNPRTYSVVTDEALSGSEDVDRPALHGRLSSSRLMTVSTMVSDTEEAKDSANGVGTDSSAIPGSSSDVESGADSGSSSDANAGADAETVVEGNTTEGTTPMVKDSLLTPSSSSSESRKDYVTSTASSEKQQEATGFRSFIQSRTSQLKRVMSSDGNGSTDHLSPNTQEGITTHLAPELAYPSPVASSPISIHVLRSSSSVRSGSSNNINNSSNHLNNNHSSSSISGNSRTGGSSTPPPILISPSMTTTKVSHSSSTVQSMAEPGTCRNISLHLRKESREALLESTRADMKASSRSRAKAAALSKAKAKAEARARRATPAGPVACNCQRHYKNAVTSTVIPLPLDLCFELLFSGKGAGEGDKLTCDTHRFKDGSTEIKIMPWQKGERLVKAAGNETWEDQKRNLEYSVTFKVPMLAKASTQCLEVQQVVQYSDFLILVHSESRTPNVPYGEQFTTVSQVCMTWESPMRTRIKCFMEVKFKKSIMLASRVESGALEGSGGYLKELIKQLQELSEAQGPQLTRTWESNKQAEDSSATDYDSDDSDEEDTDSDSNSESESDSDDRASTAESTTGANGVIKATGVASHEAAAHITTASTRQGSGSSLLSVTRRPVAAEMSRAQSLLSQQFLRSAPPLTIATDTNRAGAPVRLSLDSARPENAGLSTRDQLTPLLPSEKKSALAMLWENLTPPIMTVAAAALTFNESKGSLTSASADVVTKGTVLKEDVTLPSTTTTTTTTSMTTTTTTTATNIPIAPTAVTAAAPAVAVGASSSPVWGEFVRRGLTFFGKTAGQDANSQSGALAGKTGSSATKKDRTNDDASSLSSVSTSSDSNDDSTSRPDGVRVKFALPAGSRRSNSKSVDDGRKGGKHGRSSSSVRSAASVPSLGSAFHEQSQRGSNGRPLGAQNEDKDLTKMQSVKSDRRPWVLSRIIFVFVILGMAITALNVWHLLSIISTVVEVVEQRHDASSNSRLQAQLFLRQQQQRRVHSPSFSSRYHQYQGRRYLQPWERYQQQQHYQDAYYYYQQQQQAWENDEDYKSWYRKHNADLEDHDSSAPHVQEPPAPTPASASDSDLPSPAQLNAPWEEEVNVENGGQAQKVQLKAQIEELLAMLEHAREELRQSTAQS